MTDSRTAQRLADAAARRAEVRTALVTDIDGLGAAQSLINKTWTGSTDEISISLLRAISGSGGYVSGAYVGDALVGTCVAFFGPPEQARLHSHLAAVDPEHRAGGVGFALKVHQWAWALARGIERISWTYDPLVRRNAFFNLARLRATPTAYLPDYYGTLTDTINAEAPTDRLLVTWPVHAAASQQACSRRVVVPDLSSWRAAGAAVRVSVGPRDEPVRGPDDDARTILVGTPADITALRATCPDVARAWRSAMEEHLGAALAGGAHIRGFTSDGYYVVARAAASGTAGSRVRT